MRDEAPSVSTENDFEIDEPIRLSTPDMSDLERCSLLEAFDANAIDVDGIALEHFEQSVADHTGTNSAVALVSPTAALHLGLRVLGVIRGDTVLMPTMTHIAPANAVRYLGAVPYFIDSEPYSGNIDPIVLEATLDQLNAAHRKPAAVIAADLYGICADYDRIREACDRHDVPILEDTSDAIGATYRNAPAGSFGDLGVVSFNSDKIITTGGGAALVGPAAWVDRARYLANQATEDALQNEHAELSYEYRMSNLLAAIGNAQLGRAKSTLATWTPSATSRACTSCHRTASGKRTAHERCSYSTSGSTRRPTRSARRCRLCTTSKLLRSGSRST